MRRSFPLLPLLLLFPLLLTAQEEPPPGARAAIEKYARAVAQKESRASVKRGDGKRGLYEEGMGFYLGDIDNDGDLDVVGSFFTEGMGSGSAVGHTVICINEPKRYRVALHLTDGDLSRMIERGGVEHAGRSRSGVRPHSVIGNRLVFRTYDYHADDGMCCPSLEGVVEFRYTQGKLRFDRVLIPAHRITSPE